MESIRQQKVANLLKKDLNELFRVEARTLCDRALVTATTIRVSVDLRNVNVFLSVFGVEDKESVVTNINKRSKWIRGLIGKKMGKQVRVVPEFVFKIDDSLDYLNQIEELLD
jgi:ribosome-binding factor A